MYRGGTGIAEGAEHYLRALFVEDSADAIDAMRRELTRAGVELDYRQVMDEAGLLAALSEPWDVVICDGHLPGFDGLVAAAIVRDELPGVPVIFVSGTLPPERAAEAMRAGARDYVPKSDLGRLPAAVLREVRSARERRQARNELARARRFSLAVFKATPDPKCVFDSQGRVIMVNDEFVALCGDEPVDGQRFDHVLGVHLPDSSLLDAVDALIEEGAGFRDLELRFEREGEKRVFVVDGSRLPSDDPALGEYSVLALRDETARTQLQEQLYSMQRMEEVGRLVGGVAHDFNNILSVVTSYAYFLQSAVEGDDTAKEDLDTILEAAERGGNLIAQLLAFTRSRASQPRLIDINESLRSLARILGRVLGEDVRLTIDAGEQELVVHADPTHLEQIIMNLAVNARDAMPDGGRLNIETDRAELADDYVLDKLPVQVPPGKYARIVVSDNGIGMAPEVAARVFELYFTTKKEQGGSGLGLSTVYGLVKQSGGFIWVYSEPGQGSVFRIYLPLSETQNAEPALHTAASENLRGTETLLVVEDKPTLRRAMTRALGNAGYTVLEAENGADALMLSERYRGSIDALVTDVVMPLMNGPELCQRLLKDRPALRTLFVTGYAGRAPAGIPSDGEHMSILEKPFTPRDLLQRVRDLLDER